MIIFAASETTESHRNGVEYYQNTRIKRYIMKKFLLVLCILPCVFSCSNNDDDVTIELSSYIVTSHAKLDNYVSVKGVDLSKCKIINSNNFVASVSNDGSKLDILGNFAGKDTITISYKKSETKCFVEIVPNDDVTLGHPVLEFNTDSNYIKNKMTIRGCSVLSGESLNGYNNITFQENICNNEKSGFVYHTYCFKNNKLILVYTSLDESSFGIISSALSERYEYLNSKFNDYENGYIYLYSTPYLYVTHRVSHITPYDCQTIFYAHEKSYLSESSILGENW